MAEHNTPKLGNGEEQRIPPRPRPVLSTPYVPTAGHSEANSVHSTSLSDHDVAGDLASSAGETAGSPSGNTESGDTAESMDSSMLCPMLDQSGISNYAGNVNQRRIDIPVSTTQGPQGEGVNQEEIHDNGPQERKSTVSKSPTSPISAADDKSETDVTEYDEVDEETSGMDVNSGLPPWDGE